MPKTVSPLRQRMIDDMTFRNMSPNTQKVYTYAVANFSAFHGRAPDKLGLEDVRTYRRRIETLVRRRPARRTGEHLALPSRRKGARNRQYGIVVGPGRSRLDPERLLANPDIGGLNGMVLPARTLLTPR